ncbi:hypothetical protein C8R43DRAFT_876075, partial [Mycena crocata]
YHDQDLPFQTWVEHRDEYVDKMLRLEGRGSAAIYSTCGSCGQSNPAYRCEHQMCYGPGMFCHSCIVSRHEVLPTHWIQEWNGTHFRRVGLAKLGLVIQLGHTPGALWAAMQCGKTKFTLIDVMGIHNVAVQFCECDARISHWQQLMRVYKYWTFLAQDCNFRLINRDISTEACDPVIDDGRGFFCNWVECKEFLKKHVNNDEISTCSCFQAMFLANTKHVKGLRTTGVGGVMCARHNMWRPNSIGDWQAGERYCNMDFILFSTLINTIIMYLVLSYDIACQYSKNFWTRMEGLPSKMHLNRLTTHVAFKVPNFHMLSHKWSCHSPFSFHWMWGAGMTDGEDVEQNWEFTNGAAGSTKMMGLGSRHALLEVLFGFHNWMRTVSYRAVFSRRMARNLKEGREHKEVFEAFTTIVNAERPDLIVKWTPWVKDWESTDHTDGVGSPYELPKQAHSMKGLRLQLGKKEMMCTSDEKVEIEWTHTSSSFITLGLEIEQTQRILAIDLKAHGPVLTPLQELNFVKRRAALLKRIKRFRKLQKTYMLNAVKWLTVVQRRIFEDTTRNAETVKLTGHLCSCEKGLDGIEEEMRMAEMEETIEDLRDALRTRTMTARFRMRNSTGQRALTRGQGILRQVSIRVLKAKLPYCYVRNTYYWLKGHGVWEKDFCILKDEDVRGVNERTANEEEEAEREKLRELGAIVEGGITAAGVVAAGEGKMKMLWIWYNADLNSGDTDLVDALRVEWCKAYSRTKRWHEDIVLVDEEMCRTIEFGAWSACQWRIRAEARSRDMTPELNEGLRAYTLEHVEHDECTCLQLAAQWNGLRESGREYLAGVAAEEAARRPEVVVVLGHEEPESNDKGDLDGDDTVDGVEQRADGFKDNTAFTGSVCPDN